MYLRDFARYLEEQGRYEVRAVTKEDLEQYVQYLTHDYQPRWKKKGEYLSAATVYARWGKIPLILHLSNRPRPSQQSRLTP